LLFHLHKNKSIIHTDLQRWIDIYKFPYKRSVAFLYVLSAFPEFRNVFYNRVGLWKYFLNIFCPKMGTLYIATKEVGAGLFIQHGFATIIAARSIGENCWINQQVTVGYSNENDLPTIGNNVTINAGAKVIGNVLVGNNSKIGANAVVVKDVPPDCTVVGIPAYIVKRNGIRVTKNVGDQFPDSSLGYEKLSARQ
jgi:serine O-acetyltransferase